MNELKDIIETVKLAVYSGYVEGVRPVSLLITASVGAGKTEITKKFKTVKGLAFLTDTTAFGITRSLLPELKSGMIKHIIIPDLITPLSKQRYTVTSLIAFLNALIEEGVVQIQSYAVSFKEENIRCGLISTMAREDLFDKRHGWSKIGFMSRMLPVSYEYSQRTVIDILKKIASGRLYDDNCIELRLPPRLVKIKGDEKLFNELIPYTLQLQEAEKVYGFRRQKQLSTLMMANRLNRAIENDEDLSNLKVEQEDFDRIIKLLDHINLDYKKI